MNRLIAGVVVLFAPVVASAQIGHLPDRTPYRDLEAKREFTYIAGYYESAVDPARVAPRNGPFVGIHYEHHIGGPGYLAARIIGVSTHRLNINPSVPINQRFLGDKPSQFILAEVGFTVNLTGFKSWHGLIPTIGGGLGMGAGLHGPDVGEYRFGFPFQATLRPGLKFAAGSRWSGRLDIGNHFYQVKYPDTYYTKSGADDAVLPVTAPREFWKRNRATSLGLTYSFR